MKFNVKIENVEGLEKLLDEKIYRKALQRTIKRMGTKFKKRAMKEVRKTYNVKAKTLKAHIKEHMSKASSSSIEWRFSVTGRPVNLIHFGARQTSKGVSVKVKKRKRQKSYQKCFFYRS